LMAIEQLRRLQGLDLVPPTLDEPDETKVFKMAQEVNQLPKEEYKVAMQMIRTEITKRGNVKKDFANK